MPESISFGTWLRQQRRALDLTQKAFADQVGCAEITVRRMEADEYKPSNALALTLFEKLGIPEPERVQWVRFARGLSNIPQKSIQGFIPFQRSTNLPAALTTFIGREKEQDEIMDLIAKNRLVTLVGVGGIGKTRLALQVGQKLLNEFPNGVWFVSFDSLSDPSLVPQTVASVFDIREAPDRPVIEILKNVLREKTALLILDNCEHLLDACVQFVDTLLKNCARLKILATSRETLNMEGEATYYLPSLSIPENDAALPEKMNEYEAVRLFEERAASALSSFRLTKQNTQTVLHICRRLDGIPLAIELAVAHVDILQVNEILKQLNRCFDLLANNSRTALPRHQTMRASMDWSWGLLTPSEQTFLRQLSVFAGGWTLESAKAVCDGDILNLTSALVKKSLITVNQESDRETRYHFHEIIRQYARERLGESGAGVAMRDKHRDVFLAYVEKAEPEILCTHQKQWIDALEDEHDNVRTALSWSIENQNAEQALRFCSALTIFWERHKHYHEAVEACKDALACVKQNESLKTTAWYASVLASSAFYMVPTESTRWSEPSIQRPLQQAQKIYDAINDYNSPGPVLTSTLLTLTYFDINDLNSVEKILSDLYEKVKAPGYQWGIALVKRFMAILSMAKGKPASALVLWQESYELLMQIGDVWAAMEVSRDLLWQKVIRGEFEDGIRLSKQTLLFYEEYGDPGGVASSIINLGTIAREKGQYESARRYFTEAIAVIMEIGDNRWYIGAAEHVADLSYLEGNIGAARAQYEAILPHLKAIPDDSTYGIFQTRFAQISLRENRLAEARQMLTVGLGILQRTNQKVDIYTAYYGFGELARLEGNYSEAIENYCASLNAVHDGSLYIEFPRILDGIAKTKYLRSKFDEAAYLLGASQALREQMGMVIHIVDHPDYDKHIELLKSKMSATEFESAWAEGAKMRFEEVYQYAMQEGE